MGALRHELVGSLGRMPWLQKNRPETTSALDCTETVTAPEEQSGGERGLKISTYDSPLETKLSINPGNLGQI